MKRGYLEKELEKVEMEWRGGGAGEKGRINPSQEGQYNSINPLVEVVPHIFAGLHLGGPHIFTGLEYARSSDKGHTFFHVVQFIGLQYSVLGRIGEE